MLFCDLNAHPILPQRKTNRHAVFNASTLPHILRDCGGLTTILPAEKLAAMVAIPRGGS
jgi:hypothetical protein